MTADATPDLTAPSTLFAPILIERARRLAWIRGDKSGGRLRDIKRYYHNEDHWADFINDWGMTVDPRNAEKNLPTVMPFTLWPIQRDWIAYVLGKWRSSSPGVIRKSRDMGVSWLAMALSDTMCLPEIGRRGISIGFGSAKEDKVDRSGDPDSLFYKGRAFLQYLPRDFRGGWDIRKHSAHMRLIFPDTECSITGEAGDNIGRGGRKSIYFVDEAAHLERPLLIEASLSATVNCRIDMSSVNGSNNPFAEKLTNGKYDVFEMPWRSDPRKLVDPEWEQTMRDRYGDVVFEQEYGGNLNASQEGVICPALWVSAAVDAHVKLGIALSGAKFSTFDVADRGVDKCAWGYRHGIVHKASKSWSGKDGDVYDSTEKCFGLCDENGVTEMSYDADGMGAPVRGDARKINETRAANKVKPVRVSEFRGSAAVHMPEAKVRGPDGKPLDRTNEDFFANYKAQSWWNLRYLFQQTWRALKGMPYDKDSIISLDSTNPELARLIMELSQPVYKMNLAGKMLVDKLPDGALSPNLGDQVMMEYAPRRKAMVIADALLEEQW